MVLLFCVAVVGRVANGLYTGCMDMLEWDEWVPNASCVYTNVRTCHMYSNVGYRD